MGRWLLLMLGCMLVADDERRIAPVCELLKTKHLAIEVKINGQGPYRMIFDTGSPVILISSQVAQDCKLMKPIKAATKMAWPGQAMLSSIEVGAVKTENVPAVIIDHPTIKAIENVTGRIDGIVGHSFFARFKTTVDYSDKSITFSDGTYKPVDAMESMVNAVFERDRKSVIAPAAQWGIEVERPADDAPGVVITRVDPGSAAAAAGLLVGDRLLTIDGRWTDTVEDCFRAVESLPAGSGYTVEIDRASKSVKLGITPRIGS